MSSPETEARGDSASITSGFKLRDRFNNDKSSLCCEFVVTKIPYD